MPEPANYYDSVASKYDQFYTDPSDLAQNWVIRTLLEPFVKRTLKEDGFILDIGCGTGLFLDFFPEATWNTSNFDPSLKMLEELKRKHPEAHALHADHNGVRGLERHDLIVSLFSSVSYIPKDKVEWTIRTSAEDGADLFLMFSAPAAPGSKVFDHYGLEDSLNRWSIAELAELGDSLNPEELRVFQIDRFTILVCEGITPVPEGAN